MSHLVYWAPLQVRDRRIEPLWYQEINKPDFPSPLHLGEESRGEGEGEGNRDTIAWSRNRGGETPRLDVAGGVTAGRHLGFGPLAILREMKFPTLPNVPYTNL
jgi:hypothetical protein